MYFTDRYAPTMTPIMPINEIPRGAELSPANTIEAQELGSVLASLDLLDGDYAYDLVEIDGYYAIILTTDDGETVVAWEIDPVDAFGEQDDGPRCCDGYCEVCQ